jgi:hypothetical protein
MFIRWLRSTENQIGKQLWTKTELMDRCIKGHVQAPMYQLLQKHFPRLRENNELLSTVKAPSSKDIIGLTFRSLAISHSIDPGQILQVLMRSRRK